MKDKSNQIDDIEPSMDHPKAARHFLLAFLYLLAFIACGLAAWFAFSANAKATLVLGIAALVLQTIAHFYAKAIAAAATESRGRALQAGTDVMELCSACYAQVPMEAPACPHCGKRRETSSQNGV
ncbi:hypothetical protein GFK26_08490 [Variovorax paradoxus]|uniref:Uncharacterized protein n=1 Tax=Variovorax paradoxus TaxID=34073 RepID=A0A5Q0M1U0_VARPD|nr:hypothetical protein [Variovorax paradoxus]QFZ82797.1 hypothetical protein GFK26_08490 [Variovorax paradoxus]